MGNIMEKHNCDVQIQEKLFNGNRVNWKHFVNLMECASDNDISIYTSTVDALVSMGKLSRENGFAVYAHGIISRNPREAINCGNQLYFSSKIDSRAYANALIKTGDLEDCDYNIENIYDRRA